MQIVIDIEDTNPPFAELIEQVRETISAFREAGVTDPEINNAFHSAMNEQNIIGG